MATRQETQHKRRAMRAAILESCRTGEIRDGEQIPPLRSLARQYELSVNLAAEVVQGLIAEGVLHTRQGAGTYAGSSRPAELGAFLYLLPEGVSPGSASSGYLGVVQRGFELRIAQMGGSCLALEAGQAAEYARCGDLPPLAGIFAIDAATAAAPCFEAGVPRAWFGDVPPQSAVPKMAWAPTGDSVRFDDHGGGRQAARHLLALGHRDVAFLALHAAADPGLFRWSAEREAGWCEALLQADESRTPIAFHPGKSPSDIVDDKHVFLNGGEQVAAAREAAAPLPHLIQKRAVTAIVAANTFAARGLFELLEQANVSPEVWPAVVCFDSFDELDNHVVSALNLPWDEVGKAGAQLLWERKTGTLHGEGQLRLVTMQLIPRLTCRPEWKDASSRMRSHISAMPSALPARRATRGPAKVKNA